jgi:uncharacterized protein (DUF362 family)
MAGAGVAAGGLLACKSKGKNKADEVASSGEKSAKPPAVQKRQTPKPFAGRSKVVQVVHSKVYDDKGQLAPQTVQQMVDQAVMNLTGKQTAGQAWSSLFSPKEKVGLKPNMLGRHLLWTNTATVAAVVAGLKSAGVREENMYLWDLKALDISPLYKHFRKTKMHVKTTRDWGFGSTAYKIDSGQTTHLVKPFEKVDAIVNIPMIKDHRLAGVTCALKSIYGSIDNPRDMHTNPRKEKNCDPMAAELSALPAVRSKYRLILADAHRILIEGGPWGNTENRRQLNSVFAATDPVAMDRVAWKILDEHRNQAKLGDLTARKVGANGRMGHPLHVLTAEKLGLGTADLKRIDHIVKRLG